MGWMEGGQVGSRRGDAQDQVPGRAAEEVVTVQGEGENRGDQPATP